jgi:hypothetical protein
MNANKCWLRAYRCAADVCILLERYVSQKLTCRKRDFSTEFSTSSVEDFAKMLRRCLPSDSVGGLPTQLAALYFGAGLIPLRDHLVSPTENWSWP